MHSKQKSELPTKPSASCLFPVACSGNSVGICLIPEGNCPGIVERQPEIPAWRQLSRGSSEERAFAPGFAGTAETFGKEEGTAMGRFHGGFLRGRAEAPQREEGKGTSDSCDG